MKTTIINERNTGKYIYWTEIIETPTTHYFLACGTSQQCTVYATEQDAWADADDSARTWGWDRSRVRVIAKDWDEITVKHRRRKVGA